MAVLLTNAPGFSARVVMTAGSPPIPAETLTGQLLCRDSQILFAPDPKAPANKRFARAGFSFLWNVASQHGYLLSEALQGSAPISSVLVATNVAALPSREVSENLHGHPCKRSQVEVDLNDGSKAPFQVWRATDLHGLPLRIASAAAGRPTVLDLSNIRLEPPAAKLFAPPDSFTRLDSAETMMAELAMRQENLKRKPAEATPTETPGQPHFGGPGGPAGP
jgi:hypothetical protein